MFSAMQQKEMMTVNGGFYYVPLYDEYYKTYNGRRILMYKVFITTVQVPSGSGITYKVRDIIVDGKRLYR